MSVRMYVNPDRKAAGYGVSLDVLSPTNADAVRRYHESFKEYKQTPLTFLPGLAAKFKLKNFMVKDESFRYGLNAFKVLGASYAMGRFLAGKLGRGMEGMTRNELCSPDIRRQTGDITFITTTDGNHGRGLAWTARELGYKAIVFMPAGSASIRVQNIRAEDAECTVTQLNYDEAVRMSWELAQKHGYVMVQDTAWEGYTEIPTWIMQGYMTLALEALEQMKVARAMPTHCFLQAGVGSFAGAVVGYLTAVLGADAPKFIIVEPHKANCIYTSAVAGDGRPHNVTGDLHTLMAGLACGEPNTLSWEILRDYATAYISCSDYIAANGMRVLAAPVGGDKIIVSGESGAVTTGIAQWLMEHPAAAIQREALGLDSNSSVLVVSTEGDTAPDVYKNIVWFGACPDNDCQM
ncbi:MAG: diaminopropionate ammonia-lyase YgeX [Candidatus Desulfovibrio kirbyi]|uniref:Diaminopropionate ammonia-lyase YgeX n=1 Tax=Candidatus Desulfovibrio kirbyi TaxID=2696086 RepID=A0A6L2R6Q9_9BACT|nr:MAG: diaminopropionate ammonia-lyase YgeX [Candidatus Desulfovibrio kirbyi]